MGGTTTAARNMETGASPSTVLLSIWACLNALWSIFTEPHRTFASRTLIFQPLWIFRIVSGDSIWTQDLGLFLSWHAIYSLWTGAWMLPTKATFQWIDLNDETFRIYLQVFSLLGGCGLLAGLIVHRGEKLKTRESPGPFREHPIEESLLPPLLITSRTTHSRIFPEKHAFSYSYLFAGVPVGMQGRVSTVLSVDSQQPGWFDVRSKDYLSRGNDHLALGEKLKRYLHTQGVTDRDYSFAYLVTAPRFLGYSFNPVSFWYIYDSDTRLKYMVLEVNNTFDEKRMYLLKSDASTAQEGSNFNNSQTGQSGKTLMFTDSWSKDFHVSPFNSRKGSYSLKAIDPLTAFQESGHVKIDNTIVLRSSKEHPKIVARVYSDGKPREPNTVSTLQLVRFIAAWWWVGLATFPRIVWEAQKLFFQRKLHVWYRPEVADQSIGRTYTDDEISLEECFRAFLTDAVERASQPLRVIYEPVHNESEEIVMYSPNFTYQEVHNCTLTIKVVSPAFYSRFVHYTNAKEAFDRESFATDDKNRTVVIDGAPALEPLLDALKDLVQPLKGKTRKQGLLDPVRWGLLKRLRCPPAAASYPSDESRLDLEYAVQDIRPRHFSELDLYVQQARVGADAYLRIVVKLFMAEQFAFGLPVLVAMGDWIVRSSLILIAMAFADNTNSFDPLRLRSLVQADFFNTGIMLLLANGVHLWSLMKA